MNVLAFNKHSVGLLDAKLGYIFVKNQKEGHSLFANDFSSQLWCSSDFRHLQYIRSNY